MEGDDSTATVELSLPENIGEDRNIQIKRGNPQEFSLVTWKCFVHQDDELGRVILVTGHIKGRPRIDVYTWGDRNILVKSRAETGDERGERRGVV
jgi:hypothetical protein